MNRESMVAPELDDAFGGRDAAVGAGLLPGPDGLPGRVLHRLDLDRWHGAGDAEIARAATAANSMLPLVVGVAERPPPPRLAPLLDALTLTLAGPTASATAARTDDRRTLIPTQDTDAAYERLADALAHRPRAGLALGHLLRQTACLDTVRGLAAEAAVYAMLLGGPEFAQWLAGREDPRPAAATDRPLVRARRDGGRLTIELDHAARRNALSARMREELYAALETAVWDPSVERIELGGAGPAFCSGGDLAEFGTARDLVAAYVVRLDRAPWRLLDGLRDRVHVRVHGPVVGAGLELAAFAGRLTAAPDTRFRLPELSMGLVPGAGGTVGVTRRMGRWRTAWLALTGQEVDAWTALRWGLVDEVDAPADEGHEPQVHGVGPVAPGPGSDRG